MPTHALVTGPIAGRVPVGDSHVDVTPDVLYFEHDDADNPPQALLDVAAAIEDEHYVRRSHPLETECAALNEQDASEEAKKAHQGRHAELHAKMTERGVTR
jgi:adenine-specific DNA glycosylase